MKKLMVGLAVLALATLATGAERTKDGGFMTGAELLAECGSAEDVDLLLCHGYLRGAADAIRIITQGVGGDCSEGVGKTSAQLRLEFLNATRQKPELLHYSASRYIVPIVGCTLPPSNVHG